MSKGNNKNNNKGYERNTEFAPTIRLWKSRSGKSYTGMVTEKSIERIQEVLDQVEVGGMFIVKPVSEKYRAKAGENSHDFEISFTSAEELAELREESEQEASL